MDDRTLPYAGVELGGTKCVCTLAHSPDFIVQQETIPTTSPEETLGAIERLLTSWTAPGFAALGINSFGPVDLDPASATWGFITGTTKPQWPGTDVAGRLARAGGTPGAFDTDVNGAAVAEMRWGAGRGGVDFGVVAYVGIQPATGRVVAVVLNSENLDPIEFGEMGWAILER
jgi:fructokinase